MKIKADSSALHTCLITLFAIVLIFLFPSLGFSTSEQISKEAIGFEAVKKHFYKSIYPIVRIENQKILNLRRNIQIAAMYGDTNFIKNIKKQYKLQPRDSVGRLLKRVDIIPPELVLAQSALESNWGQSRFARKGNNLFGQWCYQKGCGMIPQRRSAGQYHEVAVYPTRNASIRSYLKNVNTNRAYKKLRDIRLDFRKTNKQMDALLLAEGLEKYSKQGHNYIKSIQKMVRSNKNLLAEVLRCPQGRETPFSN